MKIIMIGVPGAGKGTQSEIISAKLGIPTISTGNILREAMKSGTKIGLEAKSYVESGQLVPDDIIIGIVRERISEPDCEKGYILDGMPRTIAQAEALENAGIKLDCVISLEIADEVITNRVEGRRVCGSCGLSYHVAVNPPKVEGICDSCGEELTIRDDDAPETMKARLVVFRQNTTPLIDFYRQRGTLKVVQGNQSIEDTTKDILTALGI